MDDEPEDNGLVDAHFGSVDAPLPDWRTELADANEPDDDEPLPETPPDVVKMLGFDPATETEEGPR